jgi:hypothetical protein
MEAPFLLLSPRAFFGVSFLVPYWVRLSPALWKVRRIQPLSSRLKFVEEAPKSSRNAEVPACGADVAWLWRDATHPSSGLPAQPGNCDENPQHRSSTFPRRNYLSQTRMAKGVLLMFRKIVIVLAATAVFSGGLTANAVTLASAHTGWDGLGDGGADAIVPTPARDQHPPRLQRSERRYDPWGHWGAYYDPMIPHP